ncbi:MAG: hypothetical protein WBD74_06295 [Candidatus Aquilonibacter sp.]
MESQAAQVTTQAPHTYQLNSDEGVNANLTIRGSTALPDSAITFYDASSGGASAGDRRMHARSACPSIPPIRFANPFPFPITIEIVGFAARLPCIVQGSLFGVTFYQIVPQPASISPTKLGDATVDRSTITFTPTVKDITLPAKTVSQIVILSETSTADVAFPVVPGATTNLTPIASNLPSGSGLTFTYSAATGEPIYSAACFNAFNDNVLAPALQGVPLVGTPSFYCQITPANGSTTTFGQIVTFNLTLTQSDGAVFEPDGQPQGFACTTSNSCNVPQFTVPTTYQTFISGNVQDLRICAPAKVDTDCNNVNNDPQGGSRTAVPVKRNFQVLVADDPTYKPGTASAPVPWDGLLRMALTGPCHLSTSPDNDNGDVPPGYTDDGQKGVGPNAEFDVTPTGTGSCVITTSEDPKYIINYSNPSNPQPRSATITIVIKSSSW